MKRTIFVITILIICISAPILYHLVKYNNHPQIISADVVAIRGNLLLLSKGDIVQLVGVYIPTLGTNYRNKLIQNIETILLGKNIQAEIIERGKIDYPKYPLVKILCDGIEVNELLLKSGMGFFGYGYYKQKEFYHNMQLKAEKDKMGIWGDGNPPKPLFAAKKNWKGIHYINCPEVKDLLYSVKDFYYFVPEQIFEYKFFELDCPYCGVNKPPVEDWADWNIQENGKYLEGVKSHGN